MRLVYEIRQGLSHFSTQIIVVFDVEKRITRHNSFSKYIPYLYGNPIFSVRINGPRYFPHVSTSRTRVGSP